jgi:hypothetical protein
MLKHLFLVCFLLLASVSFSSAQSYFAPAASYWTYEFERHDGGLRSQQTIQVSHDTLIGSVFTKTLMLHENVYYALPPQQIGQSTRLLGTLQYVNDSIFFSEPGSGLRRLLFSFTMSLGDTVQIAAPSPQLFAVVTHIDSVFINNQWFTRWELAKYCDTTLLAVSHVIEFIGPVDDYLLWNNEGCNLGVGTWSFQCHASMFLNYNLPCNPFLVGVDALEPSPSDWAIYPNPIVAHSRQYPLTITWSPKLKQVHWEVLNLQMQAVVVAEISNNPLDMSRLTPGIYFVRLRAQGYSGVKQLLVTD